MVVVIDCLRFSKTFVLISNYLLFLRHSVFIERGMHREAMLAHILGNFVLLLQAKESGPIQLCDPEPGCFHTGEIYFN